MRVGPILTVVAERSFDCVYLFTTPKAAEIGEKTAEAIAERHPGVKVVILDVPLKDPTIYLGILRQLRSHFKTLNAAHPDAAYAISVSSGTPHIHACWLLLAASGEIPATILQSTPPEFVPEGRSLVKEIDIHQKEFPTITRPVDGPEPEEDDESSILSACRELGIVGEDPAFRRALHETFIYSQYDDFHVLLLGETGSGKEHFAQFIHRLGPRANRPMITVNCSSIPENLAESQLFGHKKGAFTGVSTDHEGKFKSADRGILFLDEIGELPLPAQAKLLRVLDQGGNRTCRLKPFGKDQRSRHRRHPPESPGNGLGRHLPRGSLPTFRLQCRHPAAPLPQGRYSDSLRPPAHLTEFTAPESETPHRRSDHRTRPLPVAR
jgi:sigma54-dependent transcription regulator